MTPGQLARTLLGPLFPIAGRLYRGFCVDLKAVAEELPPLQPGQRLLDIGGGDGDLLNYFLPRNPGASVTMIDLAPNVGTWIREDLKSRVEIMPSTSVRTFAGLERPVPDLILLSDVVHHVPAAARPAFFDDIALLVQNGARRLVIKDIEPGGLRSRILYLLDRYISGDKQVQLISRRDLIDLVSRHLPVESVAETGLLSRNQPNYALIFTFRAG